MTRRHLSQDDVDRITPIILHGNPSSNYPIRVEDLMAVVGYIVYDTPFTLKALVRATGVPEGTCRGVLQVLIDHAGLVELTVYGGGLKTDSRLFVLVDHPELQPLYWPDPRRGLDPSALIDALNGYTRRRTTTGDIHAVS